MTINEERVRLYIAALRSDRFQQGFGKLTKNNKHCAAGVACKVAIDNGLKITVIEVEDGVGNVTVKYDDEISILPAAVRDWYGFGSKFVTIKNRHGQYEYITELNDREELPFGLIANMLEETYL